MTLIVTANKRVFIHSFDLRWSSRFVIVPCTTKVTNFSIDFRDPSKLVCLDKMLDSLTNQSFIADHLIHTTQNHPSSFTIPHKQRHEVVLINDRCHGLSDTIRPCLGLCAELRPENYGLQRLLYLINWHD